MSRVKETIEKTLTEGQFGLFSVFLLLCCQLEFNRETISFFIVYVTSNIIKKINRNLGTQKHCQICSRIVPS